MARIFDEFLRGSIGKKIPLSRMMLHKIPGGDAGTKKTLEKMAEIVAKSMRHPEHAAYIRNITLQVIVKDACAPRNYLCEYEAIHEFVRDKIRWTRDARGFEVLTWPARTLMVGAGDCDCKSTLEATMLLMIGFPKVAFRAIGANPEMPDQYTHVYIIAKPDRKSPWIPSDPTVPNAKLGWESPLILKKLDHEIQ